MFLTLAFEQSFIVICTGMWGWHLATLHILALSAYSTFSVQFLFSCDWVPMIQYIRGWRSHTKEEIYFFSTTSTRSVKVSKWTLLMLQGTREANREPALVTIGIKTSEPRLIVFPSLRRWNDHYCFTFPAPAVVATVFFTVKPVVTKPSDCVPLERHAIKCDRCIGNDIKLRFWSHRSLLPDRLLMRITTISCPLPTGMCFFGGRGQSSPEWLWRWQWQRAVVFALESKC